MLTNSGCKCRCPPAEVRGTFPEVSSKHGPAAGSTHTSNPRHQHPARGLRDAKERWLTGHTAVLCQNSAPLLNQFSPKAAGAETAQIWHLQPQHQGSAGGHPASQAVLQGTGTCKPFTEVNQNPHVGTVAFLPSQEQPLGSLSTADGSGRSWGLWGGSCTRCPPSTAGPAGELSC